MAISPAAPSDIEPVSTTPITSPSTRCSSSNVSGDASSPSMMKSPICASQANPSENDLVVLLCGSSEFPRINAAR